MTTAPNRIQTVRSHRSNPRWRCYEPTQRYEWRPVRIIRQGDGFYVRWHCVDLSDDRVTGQIAALHTADGRYEVGSDVPADEKMLALSADEMAAAAPAESPEHPAYGLARLGNRKDTGRSHIYMKAADIVAAGGVDLTHFRTGAVTSTSGKRYTVWDRTCTCEYKKYNPADSNLCSHIIAVRMAQALLTDKELAAQAARTQAAEERAERNREAARVRIANRGENVWMKRRRQAFRDGDGARAYIRKAMANGATTVPQEIYEQATGGAS